ncbi:hypothetical protein KIPB_017185, partial [Kipferlia bialata]|eukprot:g17185.t1
MFGPHEGQRMYDLVSRVMDVMDPDWRHKLLGTTTDGASNMTGCYEGLVTHLACSCPE